MSTRKYPNSRWGVTLKTFRAPGSRIKSLLTAAEVKVTHGALGAVLWAKVQGHSLVTLVSGSSPLKASV